MVYLLHFDAPYWHARHYIGWTDSLETRLAHHRAGTGARLTAAVSRAGIEMIVARVWPDGDRKFERRLHKQKNSGARLCPICKGTVSNIPLVSGQPEVATQ